MAEAPQEHTGRPNSKRMTFVDALRGLAALCVVMNHTGGLLFYGNAADAAWLPWMTGHTHLFSHGVDVFFVISGFVIAHSIAGSRVSLRFAGRFAIRRSIRLDPPYWAAIAISIAVLLVRSRVGHEPPVWPTCGDLLSHLFYVQRILGYPNINDVFWTLCLEIQFYLVFIALLFLTGVVLPNVKHARAWLIVGVFVLSLAWPAALLPTPADVRDTVWFGPYWHKFLIGAVVWYAWAGYLPKSFLWWPVVALAVSILAGRFGLVAIDYRTYHGLWVGAATATAFSVAIVTGGMSHWLSARPLQWFGRISYSLYLVHVPIIGVLLGVQSRMGVRTPASVVAFEVGVYALSIATAAIFYLLIEKPSVGLAKRLRPRDDLAGGIEGPAVPIASSETAAFPESSDNSLVLPS